MVVNQHQGKRSKISFKIVIWEWQALIVSLTAINEFIERALRFNDFIKITFVFKLAGGSFYELVVICFGVDQTFVPRC
jgi:hypothetical protein